MSQPENNINTGDKTLSRHGTQRRVLIKRTAIGAGIVWVAPQIISVPAASAATCVATVVNWSDFASSVPSLNPPGPGTFDIGIGSLSTLRLTYSTAGIGLGGSAQATYATTTPLGGETTNFLELSMTAAATGNFQDLTFDFLGTAATKVTGLTFRLLDVDLGLGFWQDRVAMSASLSGVPVLAGSVTTGSDDTAAIVGVSNVVTGTTDPTGIGGGTANGTTNANATVVYPTPINKLVFRYTANSGTALQQIGITALSFCLSE